MLFTSTFFLYVFLPIVAIGYIFLGNYARKPSLIIWWIILASAVFYGYSGPGNFLLLATSVTVNYLIARAIWLDARYRGLFWIGILFNLGTLFFFKYTNFALDNLSFLLDEKFNALDVALPLAISFYTFQQIAFLADARAGIVRDVDFRQYFLFVTFFPQLIIGPIVHHKEMMPQFARPDLGIVRWNDFLTGFLFLFSGLFKKLFIADEVAPFVDATHMLSFAGDPISFAQAWLSAFAFSVQIYFDFSGYSDMALGLGKIFGINLPQNFNSPYRARNIQEFWRRWHITLSRWLRDYLYVPLGGERHGLPRTIFNALVVFFLGGLWHGAAWTFVAWGLMHGVGAAIHRIAVKFSLTLPALLAVALTFIFVTLSWVLFRAESFASAWNLYTIMAGGTGFNVGAVDLRTAYVTAIALVLAFALPNTNTLIPRLVEKSAPIPKAPLIVAMTVLWLAMSAFDLDSSAEFIYFDF